MVITNESLHKATNEEERSVKGHVSIDLIGGLHRADSESESISDILASIEVFFGGPVGLLLANISLDLPAVKEPVLGNGLGKGGGLSEDLAPSLDLGDIIAHALASAHGGVELIPDGAGVLDSLEVVAGFEVGNGSLGVGNDLLSALVASLNLGEVVITSHAVHEAGDEVGDGDGVEGRGGGSDSGSSESSHG